LSMEGRMSICNMSVEAGARCGMVAPDEITFEYVKGRPLSPKGADWEKALQYWKTLKSDEAAHWDKEVYIKAEDIAPTLTWGTSPQDVTPITGSVPDPAKETDASKAAGMERSLKYMGLQENTPMEEIRIDKVFIGSCTNSRIEDLRSAARIAYGRHVAPDVYAMVVPGSGLIKNQAETEGLDIIFKDAGFDWREAGCSMCLGMNEDQLKPEERCASTSNRNFEGRQGPKGRTHLMSPAMAAAAAVTGKLSDVRKLAREETSKGKGGALQIHETDSKDFLRDDVTKETSGPRATNDITASGPGANVENIQDAARAESGSTAKPAPDADGAGMEKFTVLAGTGASLIHPSTGDLMSNVDTDMIIEARHLKTIKRTGLGQFLFGKLRFDAEGKENPDFVLNKHRDAKVLLAWDNFGCGSSREHAPWALKDFGIRSVIAMSFGDIFYNNCLQNGMLPIRLPGSDIIQLRKDVDAGCPVEIHLEEQEVRCNDKVYHFETDSFRKHCLLNGLDDIGITMQKSNLIDTYETFRSSRFPWLDGQIAGRPVKIGESSEISDKPTKIDW